MSIHLRESTQIKVRIGGFFDATDGVTPETGVALGTADQAELLKANGAATVDISSNTWAAVTGADGWYDLTLSTSDTDTVGELVVVVQDSSLCTPVWKTFQVLDTVTYDAIYGSSPTLLTSLDIGQLYEGAVSTVNSQTSFDMDTAIITDDNWIGQTAIVEDVSTGDSWVTWISDVDQANDRLIIAAAAPFTVVATDKIRVESRQHPTYALNTFDPPTRSELTTDTNSILAKLLAYFQLALRSDAAIATDNATELTAINTDEGSGAGAFDNTTDSIESLSAGSAAIKAKTDQLNFGVANAVDANLTNIAGGSDLTASGTGGQGYGES